MLALLLLAACGADRSAAVGVRDAAPEDAADAGPAPLVWTPCNDAFECSSLEVPVDYGKPGGARIRLALIRAPAKNPAERLGSIVVNPGGPGTPMVDQLPRTYAALGVGFARAVDRFDVVGFDWRNIGASDPVHCVDDAFFDDLRRLDLTLGTPADLAAIDATRTLLVEGCRANNDETVLRNMYTENAARDLDRLRAALGQEKLDYLGLSYGSWLGAKYATLFPDRVRAFVLDAATAPHTDLEEVVALRAKSLDVGLGRFFDACAADAACAFHPGSDAAELGLRFDDLVSSIDVKGPLPASARALSMVDFLFAVEDGLRNGAWPKLAADLSAAEGGDASALLARADTVIGRKADGTYGGATLGLLTIGCLDAPLPPGTTVETFATFVGGLKSRSARMAALPWALCVGWPWEPARPRVAVSARGAPPALVVSGRYDPISRYEDGAALVGALDDGSYLLTYEGDGHIASLHSQCVRDAATDFFIDPESAPAVTSCAP